jgi:hypothetical protein
MSIKDIRDGWFNYIKSNFHKHSFSPEFQAKVDARSKICRDCPELLVIPIDLEIIKGMCQKCRCVFPALIFAPNKKCPLGKWDI